MAELWYLKKFSCLMQGHEELTSANFRFYNFIVTHHDAWTAAFSIRRNTVLIMIVIHTRLIREELGYSTSGPRTVFFCLKISKNFIRVFPTSSMILKSIWERFLLVQKDPRC